MKKIRYLIASIILCGLAFNNAYALTLSQLRTELRRNIRDADTSKPTYTDALLLDYINEAQRDLVSTADLLQEVSTYILTPRTTYYALPTDFVGMVDVEFKSAGSQVTKLDEVTLKGDLSKNNPNWRSISGSPNQYYIDDSTGVTTPLISYIPIPAPSSTGTVTLTYKSIADDMSADSDIPFNGKRTLYPYHMAIVYHATLRIKTIEKKMDEAGFYGTLYGNYLSVIRIRTGGSPNYNPSFGVGGK